MKKLVVMPTLILVLTGCGSQMARCPDVAPIPFSYSPADALLAAGGERTEIEYELPDFLKIPVACPTPLLKQKPVWFLLGFDLSAIEVDGEETYYDGWWAYESSFHDTTISFRLIPGLRFGQRYGHSGVLAFPLGVVGEGYLSSGVSLAYEYDMQYMSASIGFSFEQLKGDEGIVKMDFFNLGVCFGTEGGYGPVRVGLGVGISAGPGGVLHHEDLWAPGEWEEYDWEEAVRYGLVFIGWL